MEEKSELIRVWLTLAEEKLEVARELLDLSRFDDTVSKAYYVMFYSAKAALLAVDVDLRRHSGVVSQFSQRFVKGGMQTGGIVVYSHGRCRPAKRAATIREQERHGRTLNKPWLTRRLFWGRPEKSWERCLARIHSLVRHLRADGNADRGVGFPDQSVSSIEQLVLIPGGEFLMGSDS